MVEEAYSGTQNRRYFGRLKAILGGLRRFQTHSRPQRRRVVDGVQGIPFLMFHDRQTVSYHGLYMLVKKNSGLVLFSEANELLLQSVFFDSDVCIHVCT